MPLGLSLLIFLAGLAISAALWAFSDGHVAFLFLPLLFGFPMVWRRR